MEDIQINDTNIFFVSKNEENIRIDKLLSDRFSDKSRTYFQYLMENSCVLLNGKIVKKSALTREGDEIEVFFIATPEISLEPENIPLDILYEDENILAVNKKPGMVVHPAPGNWSKTFVNALLYHCKSLPITDKVRPGIVHRLDKDTSGVLIAAKTSFSQQRLISYFSSRKVIKQYLAICIGCPKNTLVDAPIGRHPIRRKEMAINEKGKEAKTKFQVLATNGKISLVLAHLYTGRTHQIRVHLKHLGTPILGDDLYGHKKLNEFYGISRQLLHAYRLLLPHPLSHLPLHLIAPIPEDMKNIIQKISSEKMEFFFAIS